MKFDRTVWQHMLSLLETPLGQCRPWWLAVIAAAWILSTFVTGPLPPEPAEAGWFWKVGPIYLGRPVVTSGDSPHYLVMVHSLIEDGDLDVSNNYDQARAGDWDTGARWSGHAIDRHVDVDRFAREYVFHPQFVPLLLAGLSWPWRGTEWVESVCIWITLLAALWGLSLLPRIRPGIPVAWPLLLAFCSPLWVYARDIWTETWMTVAWLALLAAGSPVLMALAAMSGVLVKHSFAVVPATMALVYLWQRDFRRFLWLCAGTAAGLAAAIGVVQYLFQDTDHFSLFHSGLHVSKRSGTMLLGPFGASWSALPGLLFDNVDGLLWFSPILAWGLWRTVTRGGMTYLPALAFFALHCVYLGWRAGAGFSARYLVPMLPVLVLAAVEGDRRPRWLFWLAAAWSALICGLAALLPAAAFDRSPFEFLAFLVGHFLGTGVV